MLGRRTVEKPSRSGKGKYDPVDQMTGMIAFSLPDQVGQTLVFVGYGSDGASCEIFGLLSLCIQLNVFQKAAATQKK
jgi:hypothetical protein